MANFYAPFYRNMLQKKQKQKQTTTKKSHLGENKPYGSHLTLPERLWGF